MFTNKFNVGDRVAATITGNCGWFTKLNGIFGIVQSVHENTWTYRVKFDVSLNDLGADMMVADQYNCVYLYETNIEPVCTRETMFDELE